MGMGMDRKQHWEAVYQEKDPLRVSWYQKEPAVSLQLIQNSGIGHDDGVIDVGGGASVLVDYLLKAGYRDVSVLDISAHALAHAKQRLGEQAAAVNWFEADVTAFQAGRSFALWHDRAVFHFLTQAADRAAYREVLAASIPVGGQVIIATFALDGPEQCSGLDVQRYSPESLSEELGEAFALQETLSECHHTPAEKEQQFTYCRFRRER